MDTKKISRKAAKTQRKDNEQRMNADLGGYGAYT